MAPLVHCLFIASQPWPIAAQLAMSGTVPGVAVPVPVIFGIKQGGLKDIPLHVPLIPLFGGFSQPALIAASSIVPEVAVPDVLPVDGQV